MMMANLLAAMLVADFVQDEREFLHRGDDDLLAACDGTCAGRRNARHAPTIEPTWANCLMVSLDLLVEHAAVGHHDNGVEHRLAVAFEADRAGAPARQSSCSSRCRPNAGSGSACPAPLCFASARSFRTTSSW